ncbi:hypothetical protein F4804DRAFT_347926 [Jackrogersella minutella]|nr:hypothetical protein F4804DRAFT_347926 [Jackrogersella minutella]
MPPDQTSQPKGSKMKKDSDSKITSTDTEIRTGDNPIATDLQELSQALKDDLKMLEDAACERSKATIVQFHTTRDGSRICFEKQELPVSQLIYDEDYNIDGLFQQNNNSEVDGRSTCRWIHLPANNEKWVHDLFARLQVDGNSMSGRRHEGIATYDRYMVPGAHKYEQVYVSLPFPKTYMKLMLRRVGRETAQMRNHLKALEIGRGALSYSPNSTSANMGSGGSFAYALFMPIFGFEEHQNHKMLALAMKLGEESMEKQVESPRRYSARSLAKSLAKRPIKKSASQSATTDFSSVDQTTLLIQAYSKRKGSPLHCRRTLDQFTYYMLGDTEERDNNQVIYKWGKEKGKLLGGQNLRGNSSYHYPLLMVDQLWLWILDDGTVITSFPSTWDPSKEYNLTRHILRIIAKANDHEPLIESAMDLANLVIRCSVDFMEREGPMRISLQEGFRSSICDLAAKHVTRFEAFKTLIQKLNSSQIDQKTRAAATNDLFHLTEETNYLAAIMDIQDELKTIRGVITEQKEALEEFRHLIEQERNSSVDGQDNLVRNTVNNSCSGPASENLTLIKSNMGAIKVMTEYAEKIDKDLNRLLNLKQQQANAWEARFAREGSEHNQRQSNIMMVFTMVTIFFLPLSFMSSLFAIEIDVFPKNKKGENEWPLRQVMSLLFGISGIVIIILVTVSFSANQISTLFTRVKNYIWAPKKSSTGGSSSENNDSGSIPNFENTSMPAPMFQRPQKSSDHSASFGSDSKRDVNTEREGPRCGLVSIPSSVCIRFMKLTLGCIWRLIQKNTKPPDVESGIPLTSRRDAVE